MPKTFHIQIECEFHKCRSRKFLIFMLSQTMSDSFFVDIIESLDLYATVRKCLFFAPVAQNGNFVSDFIEIDFW